MKSRGIPDRFAPSSTLRNVRSTGTDLARVERLTERRPRETRKQNHSTKLFNPRARKRARERERGRTPALARRRRTTIAERKRRRERESAAFPFSEFARTYETLRDTLRERVTAVALRYGEQKEGSSRKSVA